MKILVAGSRGYLGGRFLDYLPGSQPADVDIADSAAVEAVLAAEQPDVLINAAGKTGRPNVDWCEDHKEETVRANVTGPLVLLDACRKYDVRLVHISSGCIYEGDNGGSGFTEEDEPNFQGSLYARSKIWAEQVLREFPTLILRLRMPFEGSTEARNLIMKLRKYERVLDAQNSLTYIPDFLRVASELIKKGQTGIYNVVNPGSASPIDVMKLYQEIVDPNHSFEPLELASLSDVVRAGRSNCLLSTKKLENEGIEILPVHDALREAMQKLQSEPLDSPASVPDHSPAACC